MWIEFCFPLSSVDNFFLNWKRSFCFSMKNKKGKKDENLIEEVYPTKEIILKCVFISSLVFYCILVVNRLIQLTDKRMGNIENSSAEKSMTSLRIVLILIPRPTAVNLVFGDRFMPFDHRIKVAISFDKLWLKIISKLLRIKMALNLSKPTSNFDFPSSYGMPNRVAKNRKASRIPNKYVNFERRHWNNHNCIYLEF